MGSERMKKVYVIGWPIKHSRSPLIHQYWLKKYNLDGDYQKRAVEPKNLSQFILGLEKENCIGCNVTIPHKEQIMKFVTVQDQLTNKIGAVNTVFFENNILYGLNTDGYGFVSNLEAEVGNINYKNMHCVIIGAGGATRAIIAALLAKNIKKITLVNRTIKKAEDLATYFGERVFYRALDDLTDVIFDANLLVNSTSLGMTGQPQLEINLDRLPKSCIVTDIVYVPLETDLLYQARLRGNPVVDGLGMLLHQAAPGFEKWFGVFPEVTPQLRDLIIKDLGV